MNSTLSMYSSVVVDDEPLPRAHLIHLLREAGVGEVHAAADGPACLELFAYNERQPDWVFLDVQMPEMNGLVLADQLAAKDYSPSVIFVTGYEEYAIQAFERAAVDYLLKPVARARLAVTLARLAARFSHKSATMPEIETSQYLPVRMNYSVRMVAFIDIIAATAREKRVDILTSDTVYSTYYTLNQLEERLPADRFVRVHGGWIVNLTEVQDLYNLGSQSYQLRLRSKDQLVPISRRRLHKLQERLGI